MVSRKEIRREIKKYWTAEVSQDCVVYLKDLCEKINSLVIEGAVNELNGINRIRARAKIPILKRIKVPYLRTFRDNLINSFNDFKMGRLGNIQSKDNNYSIQEAREGDFYV